MAKVSRITREVAERMLESFRAAPANALRAATTAGCDPRTAKKAWEHGLRLCLHPRFHEPFRIILEREQEEARAILQKEQEEASRLAAEAEAARQQGVHVQSQQDKTEQRVHEEKLIRNARAATIVLLSNVAQISAGVQALGGKVRTTLEDVAAGQEKLTLGQAKDVIGMVRGLSTSLRQCNDAAQRAMEMSRLLVGEPTSIMGHQHMGPLSVADVKEEIAAAQRAVEEVETRRARTVERAAGVAGGSEASDGAGDGAGDPQGDTFN